MNRVLRFLFERWARRAAWVALLVVLLLQAFAGRLFDAPRFALFDLYERTLPRLEHGNPVVIVAADDASLKALGQWPWPRQIEAQLFSKILSAHPAALGLDMIQPEPDRLSPEQWLSQAGPMPPPLASALRALPSHDRTLADVLGAGPVAVGIGGLRLPSGVADGGPLAPVRLIGAGGRAPPQSLPGFNATLRSIPVLDNAAPGHGVLSVDPDPDGVFRRLPLLSLISGRLAPSLDLELLRLTAGASWIDLYVDHATVQGVGIGALRIPTQSDGSVWVNFSPHDPRRFVSAADVLAGRVGADRFQQRIVLFAATALGTADVRDTPVGRMPGTEIHAQMLENILEGRLAKRPHWALSLELLLSFTLALLLIAGLPRLRSRWQAPVGLLAVAALGTAGFMLWWKWLFLVDVATPAIGQGVVFVALLGGNFAEADVQRRRLRRELEQRKLAAAKLEGELEAGRRIQMGMLPVVGSVTDNRLDLDALIIPARQIGGDLYDFFKIDADRIFLSVADVSGKGVPAALFMALSKSLCKSCALRGEIDIAAIINRTNAEISRDNPEMLFITMFAGVLNLATGELQFCNAGHDAPYLLGPGRAPRLIETIGGPPLCTVEEFPYATEIFHLERGDTLCLMTDGVTEAMTRDGMLMGKDRVEKALGEIPPGAGAHRVARHLHAAVQDFVAGAEASDDLTILTARWRGPA